MCYFLHVALNVQKFHKHRKCKEPFHFVVKQESETGVLNTFSDMELPAAIIPYT